MATWTEGAWALVTTNNFTENTNQERCCWDCRYYIRPVKYMLDGPIHSVCTIDRDRTVYGEYGEMWRGDKKRDPGDSCDRFEPDTNRKEKNIMRIKSIKIYTILVLLLVFTVFNTNHVFAVDKKLEDKDISEVLKSIDDQMLYAAVLYRDGDYAEAAKWYEKAAKQGDSNAQYNLGVMYGNGEGVMQNSKSAAKWFEQAAKQGHSGAQILLGKQYYRGEGVPQDYKAAFRWYEKAATQGEEYAQFFIGTMYFEGNGVTQDYKLAAKWFEKAANEGIDIAQNRLGGMYYRGEGVPQDNKTAFKWFEKSL
ncbi:MAG TPA: sel1 repeat family protein [Chromatiales bacterium]|nr:sel1 repeat family protein [Thiotrichales bacterium]HIP69563.1 sel1 repeat family protein [Chromatiales bacterium]